MKIGWLLFAIVAAVQNPPIGVTVNVSAEDARIMNAAVRTLKANDDAFLAKIADRLIGLSEALAEPRPPGRMLTVGPLTDRERAAMDLDEYLKEHQTGNGPISIQIAASWTEPQPEVYRFTPATFLALLADMAKGPTVQVGVQQQNQVLFLGRMILDLNWQAGGVISDRDVFGALASVFRDKRVGERVVGIVEQMADDGRGYDLVPAELLREFEKHVAPGFFIPAAGPTPRTVHFTYGEQVYATRPDDLVWSFLRFFAGDNSEDWAEQAAARSHAILGKKVLDYLELQIRTTAIDALSARLAAAAPGQEVLLGEYLEGGPVLALLKDAPKTVRRSAAPRSNYVMVSARASHVGELKQWLDRARK